MEKREKRGKDVGRTEKGGEKDEREERCIRER